MMDWSKYEKKYKVHVYETGPGGKAGLYVLLDYMQDIASEHAEVLGFGRDDLLKNNNFWVLSRMYAEFLSWPVWGEELIVRTWPNGTDKLFAMRNYEVISTGGAKIAGGTSSWLIVDRTTKKIQRPDQQHERFRIPFNPGESSARVAEKLPGVETGNFSLSHLKVMVSHLDVNLHTNNVNYIRCICDTYSLDFVLKNRPVSVEINYLAESVFGNDISIKTSSDETGLTFNHSIRRDDDDRELCRVRVIWKKEE